MGLSIRVRFHAFVLLITSGIGTGCQQQPDAQDKVNLAPPSTKTTNTTPTTTRATPEAQPTATTDEPGYLRTMKTVVSQRLKFDTQNSDKHGGAATEVVYSKDGGTLVLRYQNCIVFWSLLRNQQIGIVPLHTFAQAFIQPNGETVSVVDKDNKSITSYSQTGTKIGRYTPVTSKPTWSASFQYGNFSRTGDLILGFYQGDHHYFHAFNPEAGTGRKIGVPIDESLMNRIGANAILPDGKQILIDTGDPKHHKDRKGLVIYNWQTGTITKQLASKPSTGNQHVIQVNKQGTNFLSHSGDRCDIIDISKDTSVGSYTQQYYYPTVGRFTPDGSRVIILMSTNYEVWTTRIGAVQSVKPLTQLLVLLDVQTGTKLAEFKCESERLPRASALAISHDGDEIALVGYTGVTLKFREVFNIAPVDTTKR